jgi:hypothetical protein
MSKPVTLTLTADQHASLQSHLFPGDGCEAVAFVLCCPPPAAHAIVC